ncbi:olfactory receptor 7A17-like [Ursus maritimus]|uniref:Olfactory receptor 7A17-like n=1 Tax=Ursus maritimus TaxID=29073 RepID=A0A384DQZ7_URSMA|nr:olfactory receptor 7A17-like [Ursus maritimus]
MTKERMMPRKLECEKSLVVIWLQESIVCQFGNPPLNHYNHNTGLGNDTQFSGFLLLGLSNKPELQPLLFGLFLSMYLITVFGNLLIILAVSSDSHLHTPMYFFLANLSFVDICFTSTTIPKMLVNIQTHSKVITYTGCISQICFSLLFAGWDDLLLAVMAYDRFVAICNPLHYTVIMNSRLCGLLALLSCIISVLNSLLQSLMLLQLSFCSEVEIPHFFCELNQMIQLACSDTFLNDTVIYVSAVLLAGAPLAGILCSYSKIISSIRRISSAEGKYKAFSTCASHLSVVSLFYCTVLGVYLSSTVTQSSQASAVASVMYMVVSPMLNPFIYTLRNRDIKEALIRFFRRATIKGTIVLVGHYLCWELSCSVEVFSSIPQTLPDVPRGKGPPLVGTTGTEIENWEQPERMLSTAIPFCNDNFEKFTKFFKPHASVGN